MPRGSRGKIVNTKVETEVEDGIQDDHDVQNGEISSQSTDLTAQSSKRPLSCLSDSLECFYQPSKKKYRSKMVSSYECASKRPHDGETADCGEIRTKIARFEEDEVFKKTIQAWSSVTNINNDCLINSNSNNQEGDFVVASYNILSICDQSKHSELMDELLFIAADILCLQNINKIYWDTLEKALTTEGYCGKVIFDCELKGLATLYRTSRFKEKTVKSGRLDELCIKNIKQNNNLEGKILSSIQKYIDEPEAYIVFVLEDTKHDRLLLVGNTRLSNDKSDLKCIQAVAIFWQIHEIICKIESDHANNNHSPSTRMQFPCWILCGDFNGSIDSPVYQICRDGYPNDSSIETLQLLKKLMVDDSQNLSSLVNHIWHSFQHPFSDSQNSYFKCGNSSSDYIWMSDRALYTNKVLLPTVPNSCGQAMPDDSEADSVLTFSDDHLSLACGVTFVT